MLSCSSYKKVPPDPDKGCDGDDKRASIRAQQQQARPLPMRMRRCNIPLSSSGQLSHLAVQACNVMPNGPQLAA